MWIVAILDKIRTRAVKSHLLTFVSESFSLKKKKKLRQWKEAHQICGYFQGFNYWCSVERTRVSSSGYSSE